MPARPPEHATRTAILRFIKVKGCAAIQQISRALGITSMAVRRHVRRLESAGLVSTERQRRPRGRPADLLRLTDWGDNLFPKTYDRFAAELLRSVAALDGPAKVDRLFQDLKDQLAARCARRMAGRGRAARVREAIRILCEEGYMAESRRINPNTFVVTEHNCAIAHIACQYPQACQAELCFLEQILGAEVRREAHVLKGDSQCSYLVQFPAKRRLATAKAFPSSPEQSS